MANREKIHALIENLGVTQRQAARLLGCSDSHLRGYIRENQSPAWVELALEALIARVDAVRGYVTTEVLADYLTADAGDWLTVESDGSHNIVDGSLSHRDLTYIAAVKCPGIGNLDESAFSDGFAERGDDVIYRSFALEGGGVKRYTREFKRDFDELIRYVCEYGRVSDMQEELAEKLVDSLIENIENDNRC